MAKSRFACTDEFNRITNYNWNAKRIKIRWKNYKKATRKNDEILKDIVGKTDLNKYAKNTFERIHIWKSITEEYNTLTGNKLNWKSVSHKWAIYLKRKRNLTKNKIRQNFDDHGTEETSTNINDLIGTVTIFQKFRHCTI